ncbi:MAG TPA: hypothetical protein VFO05_03750 [Candidatus Limnocylindrales bacterium]|nr:hypothetical protein [Candidatus Limnocylindrales bacterium]
MAAADDDRVVALGHPDPPPTPNPLFVEREFTGAAPAERCVLRCVQHNHTEFHTMVLVRTNITLPEETLALVDAVAGPRGRSRYIADVVAKQVRRDNARMVWEKYAGALKGQNFWGRTDEEVLETLRELRDDTEREKKIWAPYEDEADAVPAGHDGDRRSRTGSSVRRGTRPTAVRPTE